MANVVYHGGVLQLFSVQTSSPDLRTLLLDDAGTYVADPDHDSLTDLALGSNELSTTNYSGGAGSADHHDHASVGYTHDTANDRVELDADDAVFSSLGPASGGPDVQAAVMYIRVDGTAANDTPLLYLDTGGFPKTVNGEDFTVTGPSEGWLQAA